MSGMLLRSRVNYSEYTQVLYDWDKKTFNPLFEMRLFYQIRQSLFGTSSSRPFNMLTVLCPDTAEKNIILANVINNDGDAVPEENVQNYPDYDRASGVLVSMSSVLENLLFLEIQSEEQILEFSGILLNRYVLMMLQEADLLHFSVKNLMRQMVKCMIN